PKEGQAKAERTKQRRDKGSADAPFAAAALEKSSRGERRYANHEQGPKLVHTLHTSTRMTVSTEPCSARKLGVSNIPIAEVGSLTPQSGNRLSASRRTRTLTS